MRNRAMSYDVAAIEGPNTTSWRFLPVIVVYRTIIARRRATSLDVMRCRGCLYHMFICPHEHGLLTMSCHGLTTSYEIAQPLYDCNRVQLTSISRQTIIVKSYDNKSRGDILRS